MERKKGLTVGAYGRPCSHWPGPKLVLLWLIQRELQFWWSASSLIQTLKTWAVSKVFWPSCRIQMFLHCKANFTKLVMRFKLLFLSHTCDAEAPRPLTICSCFLGSFPSFLSFSQFKFHFTFTDILKLWSCFKYTFFACVLNQSSAKLVLEICRQAAAASLRLAQVAWFLFKVGNAAEMRRRDPMTSFLPWLDSRWRQKFIRKNMKSSRFNVLQLSGLSPTTLQAHPLGWVARWQTVADDNPRSLASSKSSMPSQDWTSLTAAALATLANAA